MTGEFSVESAEKTVSGSKEGNAIDGALVENGSTDPDINRAPRRFSRRSPYSIGLLFGFLGTLIISVSIIMLLGRFLGGTQTPATVVVETPADDSMPDALVVKGPGRTVKIPDAAGLNPASAGDFLFFIWFKLSKPLQHDVQAVFVGKYDPTSKLRPGYSVALLGASDGVRPMVYWQDEGGAGRWYAFAATQIRPKHWYMLSISWRKERLLGVHLNRLGESRPQLLGGYDLEEVRSPQNAADLVIGAFGSSLFRGKIGTLGVVRQKDFSEDLVETIKSLAESPRDIPSEISQDAIQLWATPKMDKGPHHIEIRSGTNQRRSAK